MNIGYFILTGVGLAMDAFAVTIAKTMTSCHMERKRALLMVFLFGFFQSLMPYLGWLAGIRFEKYITAIDHWLAFLLLVLVGVNMIRDALSQKEEEADCASDLKTLLLLAVATSIDALAVGISFAFLNVDILQASLTIGIVTIIICLFGLFLGKKGGAYLKDKAGFCGGIILIGIGLKILIEHLFF